MARSSKLEAMPTQPFSIAWILNLPEGGKASTQARSRTRDSDETMAARCFSSRTATCKTEAGIAKMCHTSVEDMESESEKETMGKTQDGLRKSEGESDEGRESWYRSRRPRTSFQRHQLDVMERAFFRNPYPDVCTARTIALHLHLQEERVLVLQIPGLRRLVTSQRRCCLFHREPGSFPT
uniref:Homeobox domain-containing protein n=1 Tax=Eptatretus burgeri TaxID=7764 RepID=A0A8C4QZ98_EPTBU